MAMKPQFMLILSKHLIDKKKILLNIFKITFFEIALSNELLIENSNKLFKKKIQIESNITKI